MLKQVRVERWEMKRVGYGVVWLQAVWCADRGIIEAQRKAVRYAVRCSMRGEAV